MLGGKSVTKRHPPNAACVSALPLALFNDRFPIKRYGTAAQMATSSKCRFVVAAGPGVDAGTEADHPSLHPISKLAGGPKLQVGVNPKVDIAQQIFSGIIRGIVVFLHPVEAGPAAGHG